MAPSSSIVRNVVALTAAVLLAVASATMTWQTRNEILDRLCDADGLHAVSEDDCVNLILTCPIPDARFMRDVIARVEVGPLRRRVPFYRLTAPDRAPVYVLGASSLVRGQAIESMDGVFEALNRSDRLWVTSYKAAKRMDPSTDMLAYLQAVYQLRYRGRIHSLLPSSSGSGTAPSSYMHLLDWVFHKPERSCRDLVQYAQEYGDFRLAFAVQVLLRPRIRADRVLAHTRLWAKALLTERAATAQFALVYAMHLYGDQGLLNLARERGWHVEALDSDRTTDEERSPEAELLTITAATGTEANLEAVFPSWRSLLLSAWKDEAGQSRSGNDFLGSCSC